MLENGDGNGSNLVCGTHPDHQPLAAPEKAARKLLEIANAIEAVQDGRIYIEIINGQFFSRQAARRRSTAQGSPAWLPSAGVETRVRNICKVHACRCRDVRVKADGPQNHYWERRRPAQTINDEAWDRRRWRRRK
jgi:hypothetical protein